MKRLTALGFVILAFALIGLVHVTKGAHQNQVVKGAKAKK